MNRFRAAEVFHERAAEYDSWFAGSLVYTIELAALQSLHTVLPEPKLEVGIGPGHFAKDLAIDFGLDPARGPLLLAFQKGIQSCQGVGEELPVKNRAIGTLYLLFTLCFAADPQKIITECSRALKNDGHLIIGMVPAGSKWGQSLTAKKEAGHVFYEHATFYSIETVSQWLAQANLRIIEFRSTLYQPPGQVEQHESPRIVLDENAGFTVIVAGNDHA